MKTIVICSAAMALLASSANAQTTCALARATPIALNTVQSAKLDDVSCELSDSRGVLFVIKIGARQTVVIEPRGHGKTKAGVTLVTTSRKAMARAVEDATFGEEDRIRVQLERGTYYIFAHEKYTRDGAVTVGFSTRVIPDDAIMAHDQIASHLDQSDPVVAEKAYEGWRFIAMKGDTVQIAMSSDEFTPAYNFGHYHADGQFHVIGISPAALKNQAYAGWVMPEGGEFELRATSANGGVGGYRLSMTGAWGDYAATRPSPDALKLNALDIDGDAPLHNFALLGRIDEVRELLDQGADINVRSKNGRTPLASASYSGKTEVVRLLLSRGAQVDTWETDGNTPLHSASWHGHSEVVRLLVENGANVRSVDRYEQTPLHLAAQYGKEDIMLLFIEKGADLNAQSFDGSTPLHGAAQRKQLGAARILKEGGADLTVRNKSKQTASETATNWRNTEIATYLRGW